MTQIKSSELRIGNWVKFKENPYHQIRFGSELDSNFFEPIPLSEEILLKAGFEKKDDHVFRHPKTVIFEMRQKFPEFGWWWAVRQGNSKVGYIIKKRFCHLHELQNLFHATTGEELTITL